MASLFLVLIYSIRRCKKEEKQLKFKIQAKDWVVTQGESLRIIPKVSGVSLWKNDYNFEIEYEIESKLHKTKKKKKKKIRWNQEEEKEIVLIETGKECDHYILHLRSVAWEDLTGIYKAKKQLQEEISFLVMPVSYELGQMNERQQGGDSREQGFDYDGVRKFRDGDRVSRIHWNLYAATRQCFVRKNEDESEEYVKIGIDPSMIKKERLSDYFSVFYSVSLFYMEAGIDQEIFYGSQRFLLKDIEQYEELFTDIFDEGIQKLSKDISGVQKITLNDEQEIKEYLYDMEL